MAKATMARHYFPRALLLSVSLATLALSSAIAQDLTPLRVAPNALLSIDQNRGTVVDRIVAEWGDALAKANAGITVDELRATLSGMRADYLLAASVAGSLDGLRQVVANSLAGTAPPTKGEVKVLGDAAADLVYTPVVPCRIVDTRSFGGAFAAGGETRSYHAYLTSGTFAAQGGAASNCAIPANPAAVALNITALGGGSFLTAWPFNTTQPLASTLSPVPGGAVANGALVPICAPSCAFEFSVFTFGAQVIIEVVGYFAAPVATQLACTTTANAATIAVSSDTAVPLPGCTAGYARTGIACSGTNGVPSGYVIESNFASGCIFRNLSSAATFQGTTTSVCCRVPGR